MYCNDEIFDLLNKLWKVQNTVIDKLEENIKLSDELIEILTEQQLEINKELLEAKNELFSLKRTREIIKTLN